ncbi:MAG: HigA family addiction module antidote protein [Rhizobiales bacterium]|nr:HigA family addiction module antidote protein [Hyphomicrobiales bacterium]
MAKTVATRRDLPPIHPGEILREDFLPEYNLKAYGLAKALKVSRNRIERLIREEVSITADTALRLGKFFGTSAEMWLNMQRKYDLEIAEIELEQALKEIEPVSA